MTSDSRIVLRKKTTSDAWDDFSWETDPELAQLDAAPVMRISYSQYLLDYDFELRRVSPSSRQFSIDTLVGEHIGNCSYYNLNIADGEVELGIMIGNRDYWNKGYGTETVKILVDRIFNEMDIKRIYLKTLDSNFRAQKCFEKCGFTPYEKRAHNECNFLLMQLYHEDWLEGQPQTK